MTERPPYPAADGEAEVEPDPRPMTGMPRWVKVSAAIVLALVVILVVLRVTGVEPGGHDPGGSGDHGLGAQAAAVAWP